MDGSPERNAVWIDGSDDYVVRVNACLRQLGISPQAIARRALPLTPLAGELLLVESGIEGREHCLVPDAARAYARLKSAAAADGIVLTVVSAFRDLEQQAEIVRSKLAAGRSLEDTFRASAPPGFSEHHTGRAVDVTTPGATALEEEFETTPAFRWLVESAAGFGFSLSYPRDNRHGFIYEPWHWFFSGDGGAADP